MISYTTPPWLYQVPDTHRERQGEVFRFATNDGGWISATINPYFEVLYNAPR